MGLQVQHKARMAISFHSICHILYVGSALRRSLKLSLSSMGKRVLSNSQCLPWARIQNSYPLDIPELRTRNRANSSPGVGPSCHMSQPWPTEPPFPRRSLISCLLPISCFAVREKPYPDGSKVILSPHFLFLGCVLSNFIRYVYR